MNTRQLWKSGIPLCEAWFQFSSEQLYRKYNHPKLSRTVGPKTGVGMAIKALEQHPERAKLTRMLIRMQHGTEFSSHRAAVQREMEIDVIEQLQDGKLLAYGFLIGRSIKAAPVEIPERFFEPKFVKWHLDKISAPPYEFMSVRILNAAAEKRTDHVRDLSTKLKSRGRPPVRDAILMAMQSLAGESRDVTFEPHKKWIPKIRAKMHELNPNRWNQDQPADRTIMRYIPLGRNVIQAPNKIPT